MRRIQLLVVMMFVFIPLVAQAHPLGNFTISHHIAVAVGETRIEAHYVVDMAEIPAFQEISSIDADGDGLASGPELGNYSADACSSLSDGLLFRLDGKRLDLTVAAADALTLPGQNGVPTLRIECHYEAAAGAGDLVIENTNFAYRIGWAEIIVSSDVPITTDLPGESASAYLTSFPESDLSHTPNVRSGVITIGEGATAVGGSSSPLVALSSAFETEESSFLAGLVAIGAALLLGAGHALAPGHGKTIVAAYLVGSRGTPRQALVLAGATAVSHTAGVAILGIIAATASVAFEPTVFYPYLSTLAGVVILVVGGRLLWSALPRRVHGHSHDHGHAHGHAHSHDGDAYGHHDGVSGHGHNHSKPGRPVLGWKAVAALGFSGGLVPSASAVVLLLGAIQLGRAWFGVLLVSAFGLGMASALVGSGLLAVGAHRFGWNWFSRNRPESALWRWIPVTAASAVVVFGLVLTVEAVAGLSSL